jgi:glutaredoxin-related protein
MLIILVKCKITFDNKCIDTLSLIINLNHILMNVNYLKIKASMQTIKEIYHFIQEIMIVKIKPL